MRLVEANPPNLISTKLSGCTVVVLAYYHDLLSSYYMPHLFLFDNVVYRIKLLLQMEVYKYNIIVMITPCLI